jgi:hypothetical protein
MPAVQGKPGVCRSIVCIGLAVLLSALSSVSLTGQDSAIFDVVAMRDVKTRDLMTAARVAVFGGPGGVGLLRALRFKGHSRFPAEDGSLISATVEIRVLLPDNYLRIDTASFGRRLTGFTGNTTLSLIDGATGKTTQDPGDARAILAGSRSELARLMLGAAAYTSPATPLALSTRDTPREMPGPSDPLGIDAIGDNGFSARLVLDAKSRAPGRIVFWGADRTVLTTTFTDRRSSGGMKAPFRIVTTAGDRIVDELVFDDVAVNPKLTKTDFSR